MFSFIFTHNKQELVENPDSIKEWMCRYTKYTKYSDSMKLKRNQRKSFVSLLSGGEDDLMNIASKYNKFKTSWDRFSFLAIRTESRKRFKKSSSTMKRKSRSLNRSNNPSIFIERASIQKAVSELPVITVNYMSNDMSYDHNEAYMSTDSNKTCWLFFGDVYFQKKKKEVFYQDGRTHVQLKSQNRYTCLKFEILFVYF